MPNIGETRPRFMDLSLPEYSYMLGFLHADGHLSHGTRNRGCLAVEISSRDALILEHFKALTPWPSSIRERTRETNFKRIHVITWSVHSLECRQALTAAGMPERAKGKTITVPTVPFIERDYFRGYFDGNGSLGVTAKGVPFLSFGTASELMAHSIERFLFSITAKSKTVRATRREGFFNLMLTKEDALSVLSVLYYPGALAVERKALLACGLSQWRRPPTMSTREPQRQWCDEEDDIIRHSTLAEAQAALGRTASSVANRRFRLHKSDNSRASQRTTA